MPPTLGFFGSIGPWEIIVIMGVGLLIFGKRLPEVGKSLGKGIVEFKKGLAGIEDDVDKPTGTGDQATRPQPKEQTPPITQQDQPDHTLEARNPSSHTAQKTAPPAES